jgi:hypothetical protein
MYTNKACRHQKNLLIYAARRPQSVSILAQHVNDGMRKKKRVQMATIFHLLAEGRSMIDFPRTKALFNFLEVPVLPQKHWTESSSWCLAEAMYSKV